MQFLANMCIPPFLLYTGSNKKYRERMINVQQELDELNREIASENNKRKVKKGGSSHEVKKLRKSNAAGKDSI